MYLKFAILTLTIVLSEGSTLIESDDFVAKCKEELIINNFYCHDCTTSVYCFSMNNIWEAYPETCINDETCQASSGECGKGVITHPSCWVDRDHKMKCYISGMYPHPYNCKKYYLCNNDEAGNIISEAIELECPDGFAYDPLTTLCHKDPTTCSVPEVCTWMGDKRAVDGNPNMMYLCLNTQTEEGTFILHQPIYCMDGHQFHGKDCSPPNTGLDAENLCKESGDFYLASDCKKYHKCEGVGDTPVVTDCPLGKEFDKWKQICVDFAC